MMINVQNQATLTHLLQNPLEKSYRKPRQANLCM